MLYLYTLSYCYVLERMLHIYCYFHVFRNCCIIINQKRTLELGPNCVTNLEITLKKNGNPDILLEELSRCISNDKETTKWCHSTRYAKENVFKRFVAGNIGWRKWTISGRHVIFPYCVRKNYKISRVKVLTCRLLEKTYLKYKVY